MRLVEQAAVRSQRYGPCRVAVHPQPQPACSWRARTDGTASGGLYIRNELPLLDVSDHRTGPLVLGLGGAGRTGVLLQVHFGADSPNPCDRLVGRTPEGPPRIEPAAAHVEGCPRNHRVRG